MSPEPAKQGDVSPAEPLPIIPADPHLDARLDEALEETFPASDPVAVHAATPGRTER
jgi:hypothetical protein